MINFMQLALKCNETMSEWTRTRSLRCLTACSDVASFVFQRTEEAGQRAARRLVMRWGKHSPL